MTVLLQIDSKKQYWDSIRFVVVLAPRLMELLVSGKVLDLLAWTGGGFSVLVHVVRRIL